MAATCVLYRPEKTDHQFADAPAEHWQNSRQTIAQTFALKQNTNLRVTLQGLTNAARKLPTEEALCSEIEELCMATLIIDQAFYDIGRNLSNAVKEQNKRVDLYEACHVLETQWNEHHLVGSSFLELSGDSREI